MTDDSTNSVTKALGNLSSEELREIYEPISEETITFSVLLKFSEDETLEDETGVERKEMSQQTAMLHGEIKRTCYIAYAKYQYHAWVELNGSSYPVDEISAKMNSGNGYFSKTEANTSSLKKLDEVYEYGNACRPAYMLAKAKKGMASAAVEVRL